MGFHEQNYPQRTSRWGHQAEAVYESVYGDESERFGFNQPRWGSIAHVPILLRSMPDYIHRGDRLVEVQGFGRDGVRIKIDKIAGLFHWNNYLPVDLFLYSSDRDNWCELGIADVMRLAGEHATLGTYREGNKPYLRLTPGVLPWDQPRAA